MSLHDHLNVQPHSHEFIEVQVLQLLFDTCCHHAKACVHHVTASLSAGPRIQGHNLDNVIVQHHSSSMKPQSSGFRVLVRRDEPPFSCCSCSVSEPPPSALSPIGLKQFEFIARSPRGTFRPEFWICSPIASGPLTWGGVFVLFAFPPRTPPQPWWAWLHTS